MGYAAKIDLDTNAFRRDLETHTHAGRVREDFISGVRSGVNGTPTFFINGLRYDGSRDFATMLAVITEVAKASRREALR